MAEATKPKKKREMLTSFSIIYILMIAVVAISWLLNGQATGALTEDGAKELVTGASLGTFTMASVNGFGDAMSVCLFVMVLGGFLGIVNKTNALNVGITNLVKKMHGKELILIPLLMLLFAVLGSTYGFCEETVGFYILLAATMMAAGFDPMTGVMMILLGAGVGCLGSTVNPFAVGAAVDALSAESVGIAVDQSITIALGLILLIATWAVSSFIVVQYAKKVRKDPSATIMSDAELEAAREAYGNNIAEVGDTQLTGKQKAVLWIFAISFLIMILGFVPWGSFGITFFESWSGFLTDLPLGEWYFAESTTWFLLMAIVIGVVYGFSEHEIVDTFMSGAGEMMSVVLIIAVARGVTMIMNATNLSNYVLNNASAALEGTSGPVLAIGSYLLYFLLSFLIPSTSGMAGVSMPIMGPLAANLGFNPAVMIMVFSAASGVVNLITPTSAAIMGGLALARVEYSTWFKFAIKLVGILSVVCVIILAIAMTVIPA
ncbi:Na+/H+ antiporter NhaC family protein [Atopobium sp. oral taxon 810]|uniref:YfcC family protein n=1 Tax=Atopobium sp. oral taxon 810 TaxID=712158 RepID=UPI0003970E0B|nr:Na+/H+ antiporter NhaC family protein [Atopobium sp. oral taxon 810]ERI04787.1 C4-dicarboxylate anaerobic carrier [Atopobium sp. oral taxon 810 str. F0209]